MATPLEVLPLETAKTQLRIETDADDAHLTGLIDAAVQWVARHISRNLIDRSELRRLPFPGETRPLRIRGWDIAEPTAVRYWREGDDLTAAPPRSVEPGRWVPGISGAGSVSELWPPTGGWPETAMSSELEVTLTFGIVADEVPAAWTQAAVLVVRELYEGSGLDAIPDGSSIYRLLAPYRTWVG